MAPKQTQEKSLINADGGVTKLTEWATKDVSSVAELEALFQEQGVSYTQGEELVGDYVLIKADEKQKFLERVAGDRVGVVRWQFHEGTNGEFVSAYVIIDNHGKFIVNDGAKGGIYGQLSKITSERLAAGVKNGHEKAGVIAERGFAQNKPFFFDDRTGRSIPKSELESMESEDCVCDKYKNEHTGKEHKKPAKPTWRLEF